MTEPHDGWKPLDAMPKNGAPFLARVKDWYAREKRYHLLRMSINGYWESAYTGDQTFEREDIIDCQELPDINANAAAVGEQEGTK